MIVLIDDYDDDDDDGDDDDDVCTVYGSSHNTIHIKNKDIRIVLSHLIKSTCLWTVALWVLYVIVTLTQSLTTVT
jgi:hypothetical protein